MVSEKIPIRYTKKVADSRYERRVIYDSYKPKNLREMQDFMNFTISFRSTIPNSIRYFSNLEKKHMKQSREVTEKPYLCANDILHSTEVSQEIKDYYSAEIHSQLPEKLDQERILVFDSNFESGNLDRVSIISLREYNLFLNIDTNTRGHSQWFYFSVTNTERGRTVVFHILNCSKPCWLYKSGMKPIAFSELEHEKKGTVWENDTFDACYSKNEILKGESEQLHTYYTLSFSYTFKHSGDRVYFAYSLPYSFSMHTNFLKSLEISLIEEAKHFVILEENALFKRLQSFYYYVEG